MTARRAAAALVLGLAGCALPLGSELDAPVNVCESDAGCDKGAVCASTSLGSMCVASATELGRVVLEVEATSADLSSDAYWFDDALILEGSAALGSVSALALHLPPLVPLRGFVRPLTTTSEGCLAADGSVPASLTLRRISPVGGASTERTLVTTDARDATGALLASTLAAEVAPGVYDLTVVPLAPSEGCIPAPPFQVRGVEVPANAGEVRVELEPDAPRRLGGTLTVPSDASLAGYRFELVDPIDGKVVSDVALLAGSTGGVVPILGPDGSAEGVRYQYQPGLLARLRDPEGRLTVHWTLQALDLDGDGFLAIDLGDLVATPTPLEATVLDADGALLPAARVVLQSRTLTGDVSQNAGYQRIADTDDTGRIRVGLVPGTYAVTIVPPSSEMGIFFGEWTVDDEAGGNGIGFQLPRQPKVTGEVRTPAGDAVPLAPAVAAPSSNVGTSYLDAVLLPPKLQPRRVSGNVDAEGRFELALDPGTFDLAIETSAARGFPWLVVPSLLVLPADQTPVLQLGERSLAYPAIVEGTLDTAGRGVPYAIVRAWAEVPSSDGTSSRYVAIGETTTDERGAFFLPLPPTLTLPATPL